MKTSDIVRSSIASKAKLRKVRLQVIDQRAADHAAAIGAIAKAYDRLKIDLVSTKIDLEVAMQLLAEQASRRWWERRKLITPVRTGAMRASLIADYKARIEREQEQKAEEGADASDSEGAGEVESPVEAERMTQ